MKTSVLTLVGGASSALAAVRGFNYGSQGQDLDSFTSQFRIAASLEGANDYTSARLYTMIQEGTTNTPISAIQAAIDTGTTLLLGLWASLDQSGFDNELSALTSAIQQYGTAFADLVVGISVGSEDLYRISETGIANGGGIGQSPDTLVEYIDQVRNTIQGTSLGSKPVGHVDTWNVYINSSNSAVISACDFLGLDEYPYFQTTDENDIDNAEFLFFQAYDRVSSAAGGKPIWITEAGWPTSGPTSNLAVANIDNAEIFWQDVACELERREINTWWYILADAGANPSFGVSENGEPLYDLTCRATNDSSSDSTTTASASGPSGTGSQSTSVTSSSDSEATSDASGTTLAGSGTATETSGSGSSSTTAGSSVETGNSALRTEISIAVLAISGVVAVLAL